MQVFAFQKKSFCPRWLNELFNMCFDKNITRQYNTGEINNILIVEQ
jgi:hypothetical protein